MIQIPFNSTLFLEIYQKIKSTARKKKNKERLVKNGLGLFSSKLTG